MQQPVNVAIIGAGIAGLSCAKALSDNGFEVTLFEKAVVFLDDLAHASEMLGSVIMVHNILLLVPRSLRMNLNNG